MAVGVGDAPLEALQVHFSLDFADHCHVGLADDEVGDSLEAEDLLVDGFEFCAVGHGDEEGRVGLLGDACFGVEVDHVLVLWE